jgi:Mn2+/Fe2+ NRAMP family transporter
LGTNPDRGTLIPEPPLGWSRLKTVGPGFLWMVSAAGSGELLFTPRVGAQYGYVLLWALFAAVALKWFINREVGRFAVCTGASIIEGFSQLPGPRNWTLWLILVPQLFVAVTAIAGLAGSAGTALVLLLPGNVRLWMIVSTLASAALVLWGRYRKIEITAIIIASALALASIAAAIAVRPDPGQLARGLIPNIPARVDYGEILPWLGFMLSGAAGMMWYSYWVRAKGYGAANANVVRARQEPIRATELGKEDRRRLRGWIQQMTLDCTLAVVGTLIVTLAFLILGTELLGARKLVPEEERVAQTLGRLLGDVWGPVGFWFMIVAVFVGFWDTVLSDQDGHSRLFANGTRLLLRPFGLSGRWTDEAFLQRAFVLVLVTASPILLYLAIDQPVRLLKVAGAIEAVHIPVVAALVLFLNRTLLPRDLRPSWFVFLATALAGLFFAVFAVLYLAGLARGG